MGFFCVFGAHDTAATRGQYLASSRDWSCYYYVRCCYY